jgi:excisionase family DNA binding protein
MAVTESRPAVPAVLYDVDEAAEALRLSRSVFYELIRSGRLRTVKQGRRRLVPVSARWVVGRDSSCPRGRRAALG